MSAYQHCFGEFKFLLPLILAICKAVIGLKYILACGLRFNILLGINICEASFANIPQCKAVNLMIVNTSSLN